jgi:hypothetical protein
LKPDPRSAAIALEEIVTLGVQMVLAPAAAAEVVQGIASGSIRLPSRSVILRARQKLDILQMYWQRRVNSKHAFIRHLSIDASPQVRHNFLCMKERRVKITAALTRESAGASYEHRSLPVTSLGHGRARLIDKVYNSTHSIMLECGSMEVFGKFRMEVRSLTSDAGTERGLADVPVIRDARSLQAMLHCLRSGELDVSAASSAYLYPNCIYMQGHLHILYNALQAAVEKVPGWEGHLVLLRGLNSFFKNLPLRQRFQTLCMSGAGRAEIDLLDRYEAANIDWKWEWLSVLLRQLRYLYPVLVKYWNLGAMGADASKSEGLQSGLLRVVDKATAAEGFQSMNLILLSVSKAIDRIASKLEGCPCHEDMWAQQKSYQDRRAEHKAQTGFWNCPWKGCWGPHMALGMCETLIGQLMEARCGETLQALEAETVDTKNKALYMEGLLKNSLAEELRFCWRFWGQTPY